MTDYIDDYKSPMDRDYFEPLNESEKESLIPLSRIGVSAAPFKNQLDQLKTRIFQGASKIELGFIGKGKSGGDSTTPETYGKSERRAMKELAELNKVELTTHATIGQVNLTGLGQEGFSDEERNKGIFEIQKAIDFAADVAQGGPVVVHAWEWQRPISEIKHKYKEDFQAYDFSDYGGQKEEEDLKIYFANTETGKLGIINKKMKIVDPVIDKEKTEKLGTIIYKTNKEGEIVLEEKDYKEYIKELKNKEDIKFNETKKKFTIIENGIEKIKSPEELFLEKYVNSDYQQHRAESLRHKIELERATKKMTFLKEEKGTELKIEKAIPKDRLEEYKEMDPINKEKKFKSEIIQEKIDELSKQIKYYQEETAAHQRSAKDSKEQVENLKPIEEVGLKKASETVAISAVHALDKEKEMKLKKPLYISPENIFPEQYGAHPQELKKIVLESRKAMQNYLINHREMKKSEAKKLADSHIKATFDIGHAYTWKKYFKGDDEKFNKWIKNQFQELVDEGIIGHVHVTDNMGYDDEHLTPGEGKVPIKELLSKIKDKNISINVEPGAQDFESLIGTWRLLGSPITGMSGSRTDKWAEIENSYFSSREKPYFVFGDYAPSEDFRGSPFWSGLPLE